MIGNGGIAQNNLWIVQPGMEMEIMRGEEPLRATSTPQVSSILRLPENLPFGGQDVFEVLEKLYKLVSGILITLQSHFEGDETGLKASFKP